MINSNSVFTILALFILIGCDKSEINENKKGLISDGWLVPSGQLSVRENAHDRIKSNDDPVFVRPEKISIGDNEAVFICQVEGQAKIYPLEVVRKHEIINDKSDNYFFSVSYCPLTGSGIAWNRFIDGHETTFGVSGSLFNNNLIPYDRKTGSYWSQMLLRGIKGSHGGDELRHEYMVQTSYSTAIRLYPDALVLLDTAYYPLCDSVCLPGDNTHPGSDGNQSHYTNGYYGIVVNGEALLFDYDLFTNDIRIIQTYWKGILLVVAGSKDLGFITAYTTKGALNFMAVNGQLPDIMADSEGNYYDLMGNVTRGPLQGQRLNSPFSYAAKTFAWEMFFEVTYFL
jgi:hypothetical protein